MKTYLDNTKFMLPRSILRNIWKTAFLPVLDFITILIGCRLVYLVRYTWYPPTSQSSPFDDPNVLSGNQYKLISILVALLIVLIYSFFGLYSISRKKNLWTTFVRLSVGIFMVLLPLMMIYLFNDNTKLNLLNGLSVSRFILATGGFFILYCVIMGRIFYWLFERILNKFGIGKVGVAIVGSGDNEVVMHLQDRYNVREVYNFHELNESVYDQLVELINANQIEEIYLYSKHNPFEVRLASIAERRKVQFLFVPTGFNQFSAFAKEPMIINQELFLNVRHTRLDGWQVVLKRLFDIVFSLLFLTLFSWVYLLIALAIKLDSKGSIFYMNERMGPNGKIFKLLKFRRFKQEFCTSVNNPQAMKAEAALIKKKNMRGEGPLYKIKDDPRMTRVGKFLEKTSLDELPQFFNVLFGDISVVGPRPHQPREVEKYESHHFKVLNIKPGITGYAQVNGRSDLSFEKEVFYDTYYVEHWSFWLDIYIILKTPFTVLFNRHSA
jgi:exopolysaccharide biosynthesis polyprenyl glycosylphosphotransferase